MSPVKLVLGFLSATFVLALSATGHAQICTSSTDCRKGTTCQVSSVPPSTTTTRPSCGKEVDCGGAAIVAPAQDASAPVQMSCQPAPCTADTDCGTGMVCHSETVSTCSGGSTVAPCKPNTVCDAPTTTPTTETCTNTTISACVYKWQLPCNADSDCGGADFVCMPSVTGSCSGSGGGGTPSPVGGGSSGSATGSGGAASSGTAPAAGLVAPGAPLPPEQVDGGTSGEQPTCTTTTSFPGYCQPKVTACTMDTDCPEAWTCPNVSPPPTPGSGTTPSDSTGAGGGTGIAAPADASSNKTADPPAPADPKVCQPPASFPTRGGASTDSSGGPSTGTPPETSGGATTSKTLHAGGGSGCSIAANSSAGASAFASGLLMMVSLLVRRARRRRTPIRTR